MSKTFSKQDFVDLELSDKIIDSFYNSYKFQSKLIDRIYTADDQARMACDLRQCLDKLGGQAYLINRYSENCGLIKVACDQVLQNYMSFLKLDGDSFGLYSLDQTAGVYLDFFEEYEKGILQTYYDLKIWG